LDGNSSDKEHLSAAVKEVMKQLREQLPQAHEQRIAVFDSGGYSQANMKSYNDANIWWISRVPETSTAAKSALEEGDEQWQSLCDGSGEYLVRPMDLPQGKERWVIVRTHVQMQATKEQMAKKVKKTLQEWDKRLWHLSNQAFGCQTDAQNAWEKALKGKPSWLIATFTLKEQKQYQQAGRPKKGATPDQTVWYLLPKLEVDEQEVTVLANKKAAFIVATNILDTQRLSHEEVISTYKEQGGVERGFRFLKDPFFLASSVFVKKPERVIALSFIMVLCLLVYRLAEHLLRSQLVATQQTIPNQVGHPTNRPTMRWVFQCFEGIDLLHIRMSSRFQTQVLGLQALHQQILRLLGPTYSQCYFFSP
jgi:transposase